MNAPGVLSYEDLYCAAERIVLGGTQSAETATVSEIYSLAGAVFLMVHAFGGPEQAFRSAPPFGLAQLLAFATALDLTHPEEKADQP